jgi:hypothetical protein
VSLRKRSTGQNLPSDLYGTGVENVHVFSMCTVTGGQQETVFTELRIEKMAVTGKEARF